MPLTGPLSPIEVAALAKPVPLAVQLRVTEVAFVLDQFKVYASPATIGWGVRVTVIVGDCCPTGNVCVTAGAGVYVALPT